MLGITLLSIDAPLKCDCDFKCECGTCAVTFENQQDFDKISSK